MLKAEELKILEQIEKLIDHAGTDSYIRMTFAGVPEICRRNIENDFGDIPVQDWQEMRNMLGAERTAHDETKHQLSDAQKMCKEALEETKRLRKLVAEWEQNAHDAGGMYCGLEEMYCELEEEIETQNAEIRRLKAEIVKLRMERMTEEQVAELYEKMEG